MSEITPKLLDDCIDRIIEDMEEAFRIAKTKPIKIINNKSKVKWV